MAGGLKDSLDQISIRIPNINALNRSLGTRSRHHFFALEDLDTVPLEPLDEILEVRAILHQETEVCSTRERGLCFRLELLPLLVQIDLVRAELESVPLDGRVQGRREGFRLHAQVLGVPLDRLGNARAGENEVVQGLDHGPGSRHCGRCDSAAGKKWRFQVSGWLRKVCWKLQCPVGGFPLLAFLPVYSRKKFGGKFGKDIKTSSFLHLATQ